MGPIASAPEIKHRKKCKMADMEQNRAFMLDERNWEEIYATKRKMADNCRKCALTINWYSPDFDPFSRNCDRFNLPSLQAKNIYNLMLPYMHAVKGYLWDNRVCRYCLSLSSQNDLHLLRHLSDLMMPCAMQFGLSVLGKRFFALFIL